MPACRYFRSDHCDKDMCIYIYIYIYLHALGNSTDFVADTPYRISIYDSYIVSAFASSFLRHLPFGRYLVKFSKPVS